MPRQYEVKAQWGSELKTRLIFRCFFFQIFFFKNSVSLIYVPCTRPEYVNSESFIQLVPITWSLVFQIPALYGPFEYRLIDK